jgi:hypothetical protein
MDDNQRATLTEHLATALPALDLSDSGPLALLAGGSGIGSRDADLHLALLVEVRALRDSDEGLRRALEGSVDEEQLCPVVDRALRQDVRRAQALWALLGGDSAAAPVPGPQGGRLRTALFGRGLLARSVAALWMNVLVLATVAVVVATLWGGFSLGTDKNALSLALLKLFALWCLAFLPGWLYVRFLGQRAGALWNEFVVHLHRLGWDQPCFLPRPPAASAFFREWLATGGPLYTQRHNLYRQKFDSYYGRDLVDGVQDTNFAVRVDTMFPVFLSTAVLAVGWTTVLWNPLFLVSPSSLWDMLRFAFLGAYAFTVQSLIRRFFQSDLRPSAYAASVLRVILVLLVMTALHQVVSVHGKVEAAVAFVVGIFPIIALQALQRVVATTLRVVVPQLSPDYPLNQLDGLNIWYEARLLEEGVEDMQNLATANLVDVILHTRVPVGRLIDWVDQAALYVHLDRAERGWGERRLVRQARRKQVKKRAQDAVTRGTGRPAAALQAATDRAATDRTEGSVNYALRAGTRTRVALRQVGIRTATDLLKAFPPEVIDPPAGQPAEHGPLLPGGLELQQIRTLVRVLDEDVDLAPVWNWQDRGVIAHDQQRMPRSQRARIPVPRAAEPRTVLPTASPGGQPEGTGSSSP